MAVKLVVVTWFNFQKDLKTATPLRRAVVLYIMISFNYFSKNISCHWHLQMKSCCEMNTKCITKLSALIALLSALALSVQAQDQDDNAEAPAARPALSPVMTQFKGIMTSIQTKMKENNGNVTAEDLADDIKAIDALIAKHTEKTDEMAQVVVTKAMIYGRLLQDKSKADEIMAQLKTDYKGTKVVAQIEKLEAAQAAAEKAQAALAPGLPFPDFDAKDLDGKPLSVGALKGKVVLIDFWAASHGPSRRELPNVIETYKKHHADGFEIIGVSLDSDREKLDAFLKNQEGMTWPQNFDSLDGQNKLAEKYGVQSIPFTILVGKDGKIIGTKLRGKELENAVAAALGK
jgi:peroxiredoxin